MQHARDKRLLKLESDSTVTMIEDAASKVSKFNEEGAVRKQDIITLNKKQARCVAAGKGQYKSWTAGTILRSCWGFQSRRRTSSSTLAWSTQVRARGCLSS